MAVVPVYGAQKVQPDGPVFRVPIADASSANALGAASGQQLQQVGQAGLNLGNAMLERATELQKKENIRRANDALATTGDALRTYLNDPEKGVFARQGQNALGATKEATDTLEKIQKDTLDTFENDAQREAFNSLWDNRRESTLDSVARHEATQKKRADAESMQLVVKDAIADASTNYTNAAMRQDAINRAMAALDQNLEGLSPEAVQAQKDAALSTIHASVVERYLDAGNTGMANAYFKAHKGLIQGDDAGKLEKSMKEGNEQANAYSTAARIAQQNPDDLAAQIVAARQIGDTKLQDRVLTELKQRYNDDQVINEAKAQANLGAAREYLTAGKPVPPTVMATLTDAQQKSLRAVQAAGGLQNVSTQTSRYFDLVNMANTNPDGFARVDLGAEFHNLKPSDYTKISNLQEQIKKKVVTTSEDATKVLTANEIVNLKASNAGLTAKDHPDKLGNFQMQLEKEIAAYEIATGRKASTEDIGTLADKLLVRKGGFMGFGANYTFEAGTGGMTGLTVANQKMLQRFSAAPVAEKNRIIQRVVPAADYRKIYNALQKSLARAPSADEIMKIYQRKYGAAQ